MNVRVCFFASLREAVGEESISITLPPDATFEQLMRELDQALPADALAALAAENVRLAINQELTAPPLTLREGDEVAFLPPVTGGVTMQLDVRVQRHDFSPGNEYQALRGRLTGAAGAVATFIGLVRDLHVTSSQQPDQPVQALHLEHYPGMTERSIADIAERAAERWPLIDVVVIHRVGTLPPAAQIVYVQVASSHRAAAFAACEFIMDYLKTDAVFWKREDSPAGSRWVEASADDRGRVSGWQSPDPQS